MARVEREDIGHLLKTARREWHEGEEKANTMFALYSPK
jgi:hypothetical protein